MLKLINNINSNLFWILVFFPTLSNFKLRPNLVILHLIAIFIQLIQSTRIGKTHFLIFFMETQFHRVNYVKINFQHCETKHTLRSMKKKSRRHKTKHTLNFMATFITSFTNISESVRYLHAFFFLFVCLCNKVLR